MINQLIYWEPIQKLDEPFGIIYMAINVRDNFKVYIGQTTKSLDIRKAGHYKEAKITDWKSNVYFHRALKYYAKEDFKWVVLDTCSSLNELLHAEKLWVGYYNSYYKNGTGYNMTLGGEFCPVTEKRKIPINNILTLIKNKKTIKSIAKEYNVDSKTITRKLKFGLSKENYIEVQKIIKENSRVRTEENKQNMRGKRGPNKLTQEQRLAMSVQRTGRHHTVEARQKIREANTGRVYPPKTREQIEAAAESHRKLERVSTRRLITDNRIIVDMYYEYKFIPEMCKVTGLKWGCIADELNFIGLPMFKHSLPKRKEHIEQNPNREKFYRTYILGSKKK